MTVLQGLTWEHPRGYERIARGAPVPRHRRAQSPGRAQSLEGFESAPVTETAGQNDLIVLDHPHIGEAVAAAALHPIDQFVDAATLDTWRSHTVGSSFDSYAVEGRQWAVPLDAAAQVSVSTPEIADDLPKTWREVVEYAREVPTSLPLERAPPVSHVVRDQLVRRGRTHCRARPLPPR